MPTIFLKKILIPNSEEKINTNKIYKNNHNRSKPFTTMELVKKYSATKIRVFLQANEKSKMLIYI